MAFHHVYPKTADCFPVQGLLVSNIAGALPLIREAFINHGGSTRGIWPTFRGSARRPLIKMWKTSVGAFQNSGAMKHFLNENEDARSADTLKKR